MKARGIVTLDQFVPAVLEESDAARLPRPRVVIHVRDETPGVSLCWPLADGVELHRRYAYGPGLSARINAPPPGSLVGEVVRDIMALGEFLAEWRAIAGKVGGRHG